jgi:hypothetical protein
MIRIWYTNLPTVSRLSQQYFSDFLSDRFLKRERPVQIERVILQTYLAFISQAFEL